jgi:hypothetical protein
MNNTIIIAVIGTLITYIVAIPVVEQIGGVLCAWLEVLKGYATLQITKINLTMEEMQQPPSYSSAIGLEIPQEEYYDEDDFEEDKHNKIGF